jgi:fatty-acyl-CoA synthase
VTAGPGAGRLTGYLDDGAAPNPSAPCVTLAGVSLSYAFVQGLSWRIARALDRSGVRPGDKVAILSGTDPTAFCCVFGIARAGAVWCPVDPGGTAGEIRDLLDLADCTCLIHQAAFAPLVERIRPHLPQLATVVCLDGAPAGATPLARWLDGVPAEPWQAEPVDDVVVVTATGTPGRPKGVVLTGRNIATMTALTLSGYPFSGRPRYLALTPLTPVAGLLCFPVLALGGEIRLLPAADPTEFIHVVEEQRVTHAFLPPALVYLLLDDITLDTADLSSLQCLWYGAAPMSAARLEEAIERIGPVLGQLFGPPEAPLVLSTLAPAEHLRPDGSPAVERFASAGRPTPSTQVSIVDESGRALPPGGRGEVVVRGPLVMAGYYKDPAASREASRGGWHHTGDIGYLDEDGYLYIVDRAGDLITSAGVDVHSAEVEQALRTHPAVRDCAVVGLPHPEWGEQVTAVVQFHTSRAVAPAELREFAEDLLGAKAPKQLLVWPELPRSGVGRVLKREVRERLARELAGRRR